MPFGELLDRYAELGRAELELPGALEVPPISQHSNLKEIAAKFGGTDRLVDAVNKLQELLYAA
jgi:type I restriction enzyme R subunit